MKRALVMKMQNAGLKCSLKRILTLETSWGGKSPIATVDMSNITEEPGTQIGPFKLLQQIGEGGFGVVYMAAQHKPVRRKVALKIIKPGMDTKEVVARFEAERQALALMDHTNIAKVLDAGATDSGRPYFVMELVRGVPITEFCDEEKLPTRERLQLFIDICRAIQHAHQKGVIHRDLKPTNVMVTLDDNRPIPKVIDFGISKALSQQLTEKTLFTAYGQMVGTPLYMAPEQAQMSLQDVDTRSDVYSLGVLLYELLTGTTPFDKETLQNSGFDEMRRIICEVNPPRPSVRISTLAVDVLSTVSDKRKVDPRKLSQSLRGELDWIVMKALEKDRNRRYESASAFAADVERYLADEPVQARPASVRYRFGKFARRHRGFLAAACLVVVALAGGMIGTTIGLIRAENARAAQAEQRKQADAATHAAIKAKATAQNREAEMRAVLDFVENKVFAAARPEGQDGGLGRDVTLRKAVEAALPFVEAGFKDQPIVEARLRFTLGNSFVCLGEANLALEQYQRAAVLARKHLGPSHPKTLAIMNNMALSYHELGRYDEALKVQQQTLALKQAKLGFRHPDTLKSMNNLGQNYQALGRNAEAATVHEQTLDLRIAKFGPDHPETLETKHNLATSYHALGRYAEALKIRKEIFALRKARHERGQEILVSMNNLGISYNVLGRHAEACPLFEQALARQTALLGRDHPETLFTMSNLASTYEAQGRRHEALMLREEALVLAKAKLGPQHASTLMAMHNLSHSYQNLRRHVEACKLLEQTLKLRKAKLGPDHPDTLSTMRNLATAYETLGRRAEALELRERTLKLSKAKLGPDHPDTLKSMNDLALSYKALRRYGEALKLREKILAIHKAKLGPEHPDTLSSMHRLGISYAMLDRYADAVEIFGRTLELRKARLGSDDPNTLHTMNNLGNAYFDLERYAQALKLQRQTLALRTARLGRDHPDTVDSMFRVALSLSKLERGAEAIPLIDECVRRASGQAVNAILIPWVLDLRLRHFAKSRDAAGCRATAEMWEKLKRKDASSLYKAACWRAVTAGVIRDTDKSEDAARLADIEADRAMAWLKQAIAAGYKNVSRLASDKDLTFLRKREEFKQLLLELNKRK